MQIGAIEIDAVAEFNRSNRPQKRLPTRTGPAAVFLSVIGHICSSSEQQKKSPAATLLWQKGQLMDTATGTCNSLETLDFCRMIQRRRFTVLKLLLEFI